MAMPADVQQAILHSIPALQRARITRLGYAVEYDFVPPHQITPSLETKLLSGLYLAGQINGTSGYEEAAAQGLMAGINATRRAFGERPLVLSRDQAYIGVLIDDLIIREVTEPYRMFTSRAEHRLLLRQDNADLRLTSLGYRIGLVTERQFLEVEAKREAAEAELRRLGDTSISPSPDASERLVAAGSSPPRSGLNALQLLRRPEVGYPLVAELCPSPVALTEEVIAQVEIEAKLAGYLAKQRLQVDRAKRLEQMIIPADFDFAELVGLRTEARERFLRARPTTVGQAARLEGVNPPDIAILLVQLRRGTGHG
jgi:tRNA uridine 5-carboxymethylaminomethyl modification enzyme